MVLEVMTAWQKTRQCGSLVLLRSKIRMSGISSGKLR
jgi:hypothetical protein